MFMSTQRGHAASPHTRTFESESIVTHAFTQILPHHIFHIFQRARLQWGVEARPLTTIGQNIAVVNGDQGSIVRTVNLSINDRCQFTWKKLSSLSLSIPSLSKSDTLKIRLRAFTQRDFIWHRETTKVKVRTGLVKLHQQC